jgi:hypothetical protein
VLDAFDRTIRQPTRACKGCQTRARFELHLSKFQKEGELGQALN